MDETSPDRDSNVGDPIKRILDDLRRDTKLGQNGNGAVKRLRIWTLILSIIIVFAAFAAPIAVIWFNDQQARRVELEVSCLILLNQENTLRAIQQVRQELGLPGKLEIPEVPVECRALQLQLQ